MRRPCRDRRAEIDLSTHDDPVRALRAFVGRIACLVYGGPHLAPVPSQLRAAVARRAAIAQANIMRRTLAPSLKVRTDTGYKSLSEFVSSTRTDTVVARSLTAARAVLHLKQRSVGFCTGRWSAVRAS